MVIAVDVTALNGGGGGRRTPSSGPPGGGLQKDKVKAVVHAQYNSPMAMYSRTNMSSMLSAKASQLQDEIKR